MNRKIIITIILFIFSYLLIKSGVYFIRENDDLMKILKEKQNIYYQEPIDAIITEHTMIPGISGRRINLKKSYQKMKGINEFKESLLVFDEIKPTKSIENIFNKVIVSGDQRINKISIITEKNSNYCFTTTLEIDNNCHNKHTIHIEKITSNHLTQIKELVRNGVIFFLESINKDELSLIIKYLKNNYYEIVTIDKLIRE